MKVLEIIDIEDYLELIKAEGYNPMIIVNIVYEQGQTPETQDTIINGSLVLQTMIELYGEKIMMVYTEEIEPQKHKEIEQTGKEEIDNFLKTMEEREPELIFIQGFLNLNIGGMQHEVKDNI